MGRRRSDIGYLWVRVGSDLPGGRGFLVLKKILDFGSCAFGLSQVVHDIDQQLMHNNVSKGTFYTDLWGGVIGCAITGISSTL